MEINEPTDVLSRDSKCAGSRDALWRHARQNPGPEPAEPVIQNRMTVRQGSKQVRQGIIKKRDKIHLHFISGLGTLILS